MGQLKSPLSIPALSKALSNTQDMGMVRHECAEALGAIANEEAFSILSTYVNDFENVVKESCIVALDILEYENNTEEFQYASHTNNQLSFKEMKETLIS